MRLLATLLALAGHPTVFAASSLTQVFPTIDPNAAYSFAGSDQLAYQIEQGAPADVYAAASPKYPEVLYTKGLVERPSVFATNALVVIVPRRNPARIRSLGDLARKGVKVVIGQKGVPIGDYTRDVLRRLGLIRVLQNVVSEEPDVKGIVGKVALGQADAGFVYRTDSRAAGAGVRTVAIPARGQPTVRYELAVVRSSRHLTAARAFVGRVLGKDGRARLAAAGFGLP
jgi:molybdate transport system substrate-binding protein